MEKEPILTEDDVNTLTEALANNRNETDKLMEKIEKEHKNDDNSNAELEHGSIQMVSDGVPMEIDDELDFSDLDNLNIDMDQLVADRLKNNIGEAYDISDEEALTFANTIMQYKANKKTKVYDDLPEKIKKIVTEMVKDENIPKEKEKLFLEFTSKSILDELINDAELDAITLDLEKAMQELLPTTEEMYSETNRDYIENQFPVVAETIKETEPEKANNLLAMRQGFIDSYSFGPMYKLIEDSKIIKLMRRCEKVWSRVNDEYLKVAGVCKFNMYPLAELLKALCVIGYTELESKRLITLFVYTYTNGIDNYKDFKQIDDIYRNSFASYFESNIKNLAVSPGLVSEFAKDIKDNLNKLVSDINSTIEAKEAELSIKKKK